MQPSPERLTSPDNPLFKDIRRAQDRGTVTSDGWAIAEGPHLVQEAVRSNLRIRCAIDTDAHPFEGKADRHIRVQEKLFRTIAGTETPQGILVLAEPPQWALQDLIREPALIVILDGLQNPGNAGAIARSAEALGGTGVVFLPGSANPLAPRTIRASAGSLFRLPFVRASRDRAFGVPLFAATPSRGAAIWDCDFTQPCGVIIGSEGAGIDSQFLQRSQPVHIPTHSVESLNAATAAAVMLYEAARQRLPKGSPAIH